MADDQRPDPGRTIRCNELVEIITDYLDGGLDRATHAEVEAHLALCAGCGAYLEQMAATISVLGHIPVESLDEQVRAELVDAFRGFRAAQGG